MSAVLGIVKGYDDGTFKPDQTVNRAEALKMLMVAAGVGSVNFESEMVFSDVNVYDWFGPYAAFAREWNIEPPQVDGQWHPNDAITRANLSEMVWRVQEVSKNWEVFEESRNWLRYDFDTVDVSLKIPFSWNYKADGVGAVWLLDTENGQLSLLSPEENGGTLLMTRYKNSEGESASSLFASLGEGTTGTVNGYDALFLEENEWYVMMDNGSLVHFSGMRGNGDYSPWLDSAFEMIVESIEFLGSQDIEEILEDLREVIQVDGVGEEMMSLLDDWELIETDSIGIGTGPVDYYYSPSGGITVKYERSFDVILDIQEGETTAF
jgi:hypothetical protein